MNTFLATVVRWALRVAMVLAGLVFVTSLFVAAAVAALVWGVRVLWARLTGQPVRPFAFKLNPASGWTTVYNTTARWTARAPQHGASGSMRSATVADVTDVQARDIRSQP